ncbi:MAG: CoA-disulfide reductase [Spirochaetaceae bacterium]|nr:MAG: CoA-disulfide reductase [Spirochaetaceae bacterium]
MEFNGPRIVIIGGVAAGATAAARARRQDETARITLIERGPYVSFANCGLPYRISGDIQKRSSLVLQTPEGFFSRYRVDVRLRTEATAIDREARVVKLTTTEEDGTVEQHELPYDALILAQGGSPIMPPIEGLDGPQVFRMWTIPDMDGVHERIEQATPATALVIGGGFIGLETAEAFIKRGLSTTVVEATQTLMPPADTEFGLRIAASLRAAGAQVITGLTVTKLHYDAATGRGSAHLSDGQEIPADIVLVAAGVRPNTELAQSAGLEIGPSGGLVVDEQLRTADPAILAAGDMIELRRRVDGRQVRVPLAGPANRQGRIAAMNALGGSARYAGALGSSVFKVMDDTFAMTGLSEKAAREAGFDTGAMIVHRGSHAGYYPGAMTLSLKLVYDKANHRLLGAQAFGAEGVEKRIDVAATALAGELTLDDIAELDLTYAPPYSSANDPLNMAAFAALNDLSGYSPAIAAAELPAVPAAPAVMLDVRTYGESSKDPVDGAVVIPLDELRMRMDELQKDARIVVLSRDGYEGHIATRQLKLSGFEKVAYIAGGMLSLKSSIKQEV